MTQNKYLPKGYKLGQYTIRTVTQNDYYSSIYSAFDSLGNLVSITELFFEPICDRDRDGSVVTNYSDSTTRERFNTLRMYFLKEAIKISQISHPNIQKIIDLFEQNNTIYYVSNYIEGNTLRQLRLSQQTININHYFNQIINAVEHIHSNGILHLDINPNNILIDRNDNIILFNFSSYKIFDPIHLQYVHHINYFNSHGYSPIEIALSVHKDIGPHSDIYSLAATFIFCFIGKRPCSVHELFENNDIAISKLLPNNVNLKIRTAIVHAMQLSLNNRTKNIHDFSFELEHGCKKYNSICKKNYHIPVEKTEKNLDEFIQESGEDVKNVLKPKNSWDENSSFFSNIVKFLLNDEPKHLGEIPDYENEAPPTLEEIIDEVPYDDFITAGDPVFNGVIIDPDYDDLNDSAHKTENPTTKEDSNQPL